MIRPRLPGLLLAYFSGYVALDWLSYVYPVVPLGITPWNPPIGLSLFFLMRFGVRLWPAMLAAAVAAELLVRGGRISLPMIVAASIVTAGYVATAMLLTRRLNVRLLESTRDLVMFFCVSMAATLIVATSFVAAYSAFGMVSRPDVRLDILRYWVGDLNGLLVVTPALFYITQVRPTRMALRRIVSGEVGLQFLTLVGALALIFAFGDQYPFRSFYVLVLPLIWISTRWGLPGAALAQGFIQLGLIASVQITDYRAATFVQLQWLMSGLCVTGLTVGALSSHRSRLEFILRDRQAALNRAQQFASAGEMTSALAHQLNQPLTALNGYVGACRVLVRQPVVDIPRLTDLMNRIDSEGRRASECITRLRDFYRAGAVVPSHIEAGRLVDNVVRVIQRNADAARVEIQRRPGPWQCMLRIDTVQIENAIQNLLLNAIDAMTDFDRADRRIIICLEETPTHAHMRFRDTGPGVAPDIAPALFEPFTTSKAAGIGLGLAIARSLVRASGGDLSLEASDSRSGACFLMRLPTSAAPVTTP